MTGYEKKMGFLLIEVFSKLFNTKFMATKVRSLVAFYCLSGLLVNTSNTPIHYHQNNARGLLVNITSLPLNDISPTNPFLDIRVSKNFIQKFAMEYGYN
jgi:hypothetical protein